MKKQINLNNLIDGKYSVKFGVYEELTDDQIEKCFAGLKSFLLSHCRKGSKAYKTIDFNLSLDKLENIDLFNRVVFGSDGRCWYQVYQDKTPEIKNLKKQIIKML